MKKLLGVIAALSCAGALFAVEASDGPSLPIGSSGKLNVEASTEFVADLNDGSTGLDTNVGIEFVFDLVPRANRGLTPDNTDTPVVKLTLENASFTWWNSYYLDNATDGGANWDQDDVNSWTAVPLVLTFDSLTADVLYKNFYFRVAGTKPTMEVDLASMESIFDDVMDASDRWYVEQKLALYYDTRYNSLNLPLLQDVLTRDLVDVDSSVYSTPSGMLGVGYTGDKFEFGLKAASFAPGGSTDSTVTTNEDNAWMFGFDSVLKPINNLKLTLTGLAAVNYEKTTVGDNPYAGGAKIEYLLPFSKDMILKPFAGFDYEYLKVSKDSSYEAGGGFYLYFRGTDTKVSHRDIDFDDVIPVGLSFSANYGKESVDSDPEVNAVFSLFEMADEDAIIPNLGGYAEVELANVTAANDKDFNYAALVEVEYSILGKVLPYVSEKYGPQVALNSDGITYSTNGKIQYVSTVGVYFTPIKNFAIDINYSRTDITTTSTSKTALDNGAISTTFTISM